MNGSFFLDEQGPWDAVQNLLSEDCHGVHFECDFPPMFLMKEIYAPWLGANLSVRFFFRGT